MGLGVRSRRQFEATPLGVREARHWVTSVLDGATEVADAAELVVSELGSNVVRHTQDHAFEVAVEVEASCAFRISVSDGVETDLRAAAAEGDEESGRGLAIVEALSARWGVERTASGKRVWVELRPPG